MKKNVFAKIALIAAAGFAVNAFAASPASTTFQVKIVVQKSCVIATTAASDIDFGTVDASATNLQGSSSLTVNCSKNTPYTIALKPTAASTSGAGAMISAPAGDTVAYQLRQATGMAAAVWGNVVGTNTVAGSGDGTVQTKTIYATVPSANVLPVAYSDTVTISVAF